MRVQLMRSRDDESNTKRKKENKNQPSPPFYTRSLFNFPLIPLFTIPPPLLFPLDNFFHGEEKEKKKEQNAGWSSALLGVPG